MAIKAHGGDFSSNRGSGFHADEGSTLNLHNCVSEHNAAHGVAAHVTSEVNLYNHTSRFNGGDGVHVFNDEEEIINQLNLPSSIDMNELRNLLAELKETPAENRKELISSSFLAKTDSLLSIGDKLLQLAIQYWPA